MGACVVGENTQTGKGEKGETMSEKEAMKQLEEMDAAQEREINTLIGNMGKDVEAYQKKAGAYERAKDNLSRLEILGDDPDIEKLREEVEVLRAETNVLREKVNRTGKHGKEEIYAVISETATSKLHVRAVDIVDMAVAIIADQETELKAILDGELPALREQYITLLKTITAKFDAFYHTHAIGKRAERCLPIDKHRTPKVSTVAPRIEELVIGEGDLINVYVRALKGNL